MAVNEDFEGQSSSIDALNDVSEAEWQIAQAEADIVAPPEVAIPSAAIASNEEDSAPNADADGQSIPVNSIEFSVDGNNAVRLPANADLGELRLNGSNLEFVQPDGSIFVILQGAVQGLTIFLGDVQLPAEAVAALFQANDIQPAAGPDVGGEQTAEQPLPEGRGAYQDSSQGSIGDGIGITSLLPPTALAFPEPEQEELFEGIPEEDDGDPAFPALDAGTGAFVDEEALSYGSNPTSDQEKTSGNLAISTGPNSVSSLFIDGVDVTNGGSVTTGSYGTLVVTGSPSTGYSWEYTLDANTEDHLDDTSTGTSEGIFDDFTIVLTDSSGATVSDTLQVDVLDDGPLTPTIGTPDTAVLLTYDGGLSSGNYFDAGGGSGDTNSDPAIAVVDFSSAFTISENFGADGAGATTTTYALAFDSTFTEGSNTGLNSGGNNVYLHLIAGQYVGSTEAVEGDVLTANTVFTLDLNTTSGELTLTQNLPIDHTSDVEYNDAYIADVQSLAADILELTATAVTTDSEGDTATATATIDLGGNISFGDDGPDANADTGAVNEGALLTVLVGDGVLSNDEGGADGLASIEGVRAAGGDTTSDVSGGVTGSIAGEHGTLVLAANGSYTYQSTANAITGNVSDVFVYTIIDGDGDLATTTLTINLTNGTDPTVSAPITLVLDDEHLADGSDPTADDFAQDALTFTPGSNAISSIVFDTVLTNLTGGLTWTRVSDTQITGKDGAAGPTIVTLDLSVTSNVATVTATLNDNYDNHPTVNVDDLQDLGSVGVVATDTGAVSVTGFVNVDVSDDLPQAFVADVVYADDVTAFTTVGNLNFADVAGADGVGSIGFDFTEGAAALDSEGNAIKLNGDPVYLYEGADSTILVGATGANATTGVAFTIDLDPVAGTYSFTIDEGTIANGETSSFSNLSGVGGGNNNLYALGTTTAGGNDIILSGSDTINTNANNIGIANQQAITTGEILRFDFRTNVTAVDPNVVAGDYYTLTKFAQELNSTSGNTASFSIKIIDTDGDNDFYGDAGDTFITDSFTVKLYNGNPATTGVLQSTFNSVGGVATITGADEGWFYEIESTTPFEAVQYEGLNNIRVKLGEIAIETINAIDPFTMDVALTGEDGDGDTTTGELEINFLPPAPTIIGTESDDASVSGTTDDDFLLGLGGTDILTGGDGDDVLIGGAGSDTMTGGADADTFIIGADSLDLAIEDVITDYSESAGDEIDLSEILGGLGLTNADDLDADGFVSVTQVGVTNEYTVAVDKDGTAGTAFSSTDVASVTVLDGTSISILFDDDETPQDVSL